MPRAKKTKPKVAFEPGQVIFLTSLEDIESKEIVLEVLEHDIDSNVVYSTKVILLHKEAKGNDISLTPLSNAFILSTVKSTESVPTVTPNAFLLGNFDIVGEVTNPEILAIFRKSFPSVEEN